MKINKKFISVLPFILLFILGFAVAAYPLISQYYYRIESSEQIALFESGKKAISDEELRERMKLAHAYNRTLDPSKLADPYTEEERAGVAEYARMLEVQEKLGYVEIPAIDENIPIYAGTVESILQKGAGHLEGTSLPVGGMDTHTVITAHRGLPTAKLFRRLNELKKGDIFYIHNIETVLAYKVDQIITVEPWDFDPVLVVEGRDLCTLLTCTPYMINSHRLLVRGERVDYVAPIYEGAVAHMKVDMQYRMYFYIALALLLLLLFVYLYYRKQLAKVRKKIQKESGYEEKK